MHIQLSDHSNYSKLLRLAFPSVVMLVFTSVYGVVDGFFVSNYVGKTPFTAVNFIMPFLMILGSFGFMFGTGGGALIAKTMGEGKTEQANRLFSLIIYISPRHAVFYWQFWGLFLSVPLRRRLARMGRCWKTVSPTDA